MSTILIASHNRAKVAEVSEGIKTFCPRFTTVSLADLGISDNREENGQSFKENASLKAHFYAKLANLPTIADDGGIMIDYLHGEPGVKTRRWLGYEMSDQELIEHTLKSLKNIKPEERTAKFRACLFYFNPQTNLELTESEDVLGTIAEKAVKTAADGYPFRKIFIVKGLNKYYADMTHDEHLRVNHRYKALKRLMKNISSELL